MGFTTAPVSAWPLGWVALAPLWFLVVSNHKTKINPKSKIQNLKFFLTTTPLILGLAWGIGYHGLALFWITGIHPMTWMGVPWLASLAIAFFCWSFITLWGAALVATWATFLFWIEDFGFWINRKSPISGLTRVLIGTALWCGLESFWSAGALWWTSLSFTQSPHNLAILHLGQLSGPSAVTVALVAVNGLIAEGWISSISNSNLSKVVVSNENRVAPLVGNTIVEPKQKHKDIKAPINWKYFGIAAGLWLSLHLIGFGLYSRPLILSSASALKVGIIQGNIPNEIKLYPGGLRQAIEGYTSGYRKLADQGVEAVLTPEGALPFSQSDLTLSSFFWAVREKGVVAWIGAFGEQGSSYTNSLFTLTGTGEIFSRYDKVKLVPIGEYVPFEQFLGDIVKRLSPLDEHQVAGSPNQRFDTPFGRAIVGICYDSAFSQHFRRQAAAGGQFILTASNNAHYSKTMPAQHHAQDVMRAIETDRWAVRATNTGYSGIVDPHGRTLWISGIKTYEVHADTVYRRQSQTLYVRWGDWLTPGLLLGGAIACLLNFFWRDEKLS
jgi:apolipoprotein N-acyltransferase